MFLFMYMRPYHQYHGALPGRILKCMNGQFLKELKVLCLMFKASIVVGEDIMFFNFTFSLISIQTYQENMNIPKNLSFYFVQRRVSRSFTFFFPNSTFSLRRLKGLGSFLTTLQSFYAKIEFLSLKLGDFVISLSIGDNGQ